MAVSVALASWMLADGDAAGDVATVAGLFVGIASLVLALTDFFRQEPARPDPAALADDLAHTLRGQWLEEAEARRLRDPRVLPLTWATTARPVADEPRAAGLRVLRVRLDGRLEGRFDEAIARLADGYAQLDKGRLVVIGEPGAGKTVLAMLLTLGLIGAREPGGAVPVLLPVSSWDPVRERLDDWIVGTLALPYYNGRPHIPRLLLSHGLLLPVLDGLDEIPESARRSAIHGINHAIGGERPVVVTCRATEYEDLVRGGAPTLRQAPVVEISPVSPEDVITYLRQVDWPTGVHWDAAFARLRSDPGGPVGSALSTPLMVTSARLVYRRGHGDPGELLDGGRFDCRYAVEDHLTHGLIDAAYEPAGPGGPEDADEARWSAERARRWLTFLACYLHDHRERDLAWWLMSGRLLSRWAGPMVGLGTGAVLSSAAVAWAAVSGSVNDDNKSQIVVTYLCLGGGFALLASLVWYASGTRLPGRLSWVARRSTERLLQGFRNGAGFAMVCVVPLLAGFTVYRVSGLVGGYVTPAAVELYVEAATVSLALAALVGLALAVHGWLDAPPSRAAQASPRNSLSQDRHSALVGAFAAGLVVAAAGMVTWYVGVLAGDLLLRLCTGWAGWPGSPDVALLAGDSWEEVTGALGNRRAALGVAVVLPGAVFALLVLTGRAWPRFLLARIYLAARGRLPWRLMAFLADARRRELLRQSGGAYQFRHIRLQETLAGEPTYADRVGDRRVPASARRSVRRRVLLTAGATASLALTAGALSGRGDESEAVFTVPERDPATGVVFRPGGRETACVSGGRVWLWGGYGRGRGARLLCETSHDPEAGSHVAFHPAGRFLAVNDGAVVELWDVRDDSLHARLDVEDPSKEPFSGLAFLDGGRRLVGVLSAGMCVWESRDGRRFELASAPAFERGSASPSAWAFLRDGSLAALDVLNGEVWHYLPTTYRRRSRLLTPDQKIDLYEDETVSDIAASRYEDRLALFGAHEGELWRRGSGGAWQRSPGTFGDACAVGFHPDRPLLAAADPHQGDVHLWDIGGTSEPRRVKRLPGHSAAVTAMDFTSDGRRLATASEDGTVRLWNLDELL
ncbi:NACHT domain-containing protein [Streptomyces sp. PA5.6]|uniref:NACHT and WD40 repeat domain-containing protein n=1 Tax=Streptomyces sp. PA5.6 TaxID=3035651 RepID=UPI003904B3E7